jgi:alcohol dehydrogenase class IV
LTNRQPEHPALARYSEIAQILKNDPGADAADGVNWVSKLVRDLNIPSLSSYGMGREHFSEAVEKTLKASSFKGNPILLTEAELMGILERAL